MKIFWQKEYPKLIAKSCIKKRKEKKLYNEDLGNTFFMSLVGMYHKILPEATPNMKPTRGSRMPFARDQIQLPEGKKII